VWHSAAAAEALKEWDGGRQPRERSLWRCPGWGITPGKFFENIGANMCNLVHFGDIRSSKVVRKIDVLGGTHRPCRIGSDFAMKQTNLCRLSAT